MTPDRPSSEPIIFQPIFKEKLWGGQKLKTALSKEIPENTAIGESWELSGYGSELSIAVAEDLHNVTIQQILENNPKEFLGDIHFTSFFPLLYKFIDANANLSVQVHPNDTQARENGWGTFGKTECWYIIEAKANARIVVGFKNGVTLDNVELGIKNNTLDTILNSIPITKGDVLFIPAGTVHAILDGTLLYEVQETSDITFRLYDWGRVDETGKPRQLHIAESLKVLDTSYHDRHKITPVLIENTDGIHHFFRAACKYFALEEYFFENYAKVSLPPKKSFTVISVLEGSISLNVDTTSIHAVSIHAASIHAVSKGQTMLIPAVCCNKAIDAEGEINTRFILSTVPDLKKEVVDTLRNFGISDEAIALLGGDPAKNDISPLL